MKVIIVGIRIKYPAPPLGQALTAASPKPRGKEVNRSFQFPLAPSQRASDSRLSPTPGCSENLPVFAGLLGNQELPRSPQKEARGVDIVGQTRTSLTV